MNDKEKLAMCIGFLKAVIADHVYFASINVQAVKQLIGEISDNS